MSFRYSCEPRRAAIASAGLTLRRERGKGEIDLSDDPNTIQEPCMCTRGWLHESTYPQARSGYRRARINAKNRAALARANCATSRSAAAASCSSPRYTSTFTLFPCQAHKDRSTRLTRFKVALAGQISRAMGPTLCLVVMIFQTREGALAFSRCALHKGSVSWRVGGLVFRYCSSFVHACCANDFAAFQTRCWHRTSRTLLLH